MNNDEREAYESSINFLESMIQAKETRIAELNTVGVARQIVLNNKAEHLRSALHESQQLVYDLKLRNNMLVDESKKLIALNHKILNLLKSVK